MFLVGVALGFVIIFMSQDLVDNRLAQGEQFVTEHPLGRPVTDRLMWERNPKFLEICAQQGAFVRMGAFQTTLPDPLRGEEENVAHAANLLAGNVVAPGEVFSMNARLGPYTKQRGYKDGPIYMGTRVATAAGGGVCKIASTLFNVVVLADLQVVQRHPHGMLVPYVPPGQDATVAYGVKDFKFKNNTGRPVVIWSETLGNTLYMAIYGSRVPPKVTWQHTILKRQKTWTIRRYNPNLQPGEKRVVIPGDDGLAVRSTLIKEYSNGEIVTQELGTWWYNPLPRVIELGPSN